MEQNGGKEQSFRLGGHILLEGVFSNNEMPEHNYDFYYYIINDPNNRPLLLTFFTYGLWKEDMLASTSVSIRMERERVDDPYLHTSYALSMGSFITEGEQLYLDRSDGYWKDALSMLIGEIEILEKTGAPDLDT